MGEGMTAARSCARMVATPIRIVLGLVLLMLAFVGAVTVVLMLYPVHVVAADRPEAPAPAAAQPAASGAGPYRLARPWVLGALMAMLSPYGSDAHAAGAGWTVGLHTVSWHDQPGYHSATPGLYAMAPNGATAGVLRNSQGRLGAYAGWTWQTTHTLPVRAAVTAGVVTGYSLGPVLPMVVPSVAVQITPRTALRVVLLPAWHPKQGANAANLAMEISL